MINLLLMTNSNTARFPIVNTGDRWCIVFSEWHASIQSDGYAGMQQ